ncbi:MAG: HAMP domain-containing sensor histidine kinase, partial [Saprospiraceae bacterium]|nr:HAMP domain-containing sensor histidine kinase [Saprospiraceae bacterium]
LLFSQKAADIYARIDTARGTLPAAIMRGIDRLWGERHNAERLTVCQLEVFGYLDEHRLELTRSGLVRVPARQAFDAEGMPCVLSFLPAAKDTSWVLLTSADTLVAMAIDPLMHQFSRQGTWIWSMRDDAHPSAGARDVNMPEHHTVEARFPAYLPHLTLVGTAQPVSFVGSMLRSGRGGYLYIFVFIGVMFITGLLFVTYSINRELHLNKMKSEFVATVSHEFKSPLTAIRQMTEMLQRGRVPPEKRDKYYTVMLQQGSRLTHLIDNILDFSSIEQGKKTYQFRAANLLDLIHSSVEECRRRHGDSGFIVSLDAASAVPEVVIDVSAIRQVMDNLLDNAVKYSGEAREIEVQVKKAGSTVQVSVRDHGIGIPEHDHERVFDRFYRVESDTGSARKGSGIGLNLVREIIGAHGGSARLESTPGQGTIVYFDLPTDK